MDLSVENEEQALALRDYLETLREILDCEVGGDYVASPMYKNVLEEGISSDQVRLDQLRHRLADAKRRSLQAGFSMPTTWLAQWPPDLVKEEHDPFIHVTATMDARMRGIAEEVEALLFRWEASGKPSSSSALEDNRATAGARRKSQDAVIRMREVIEQHPDGRTAKATNLIKIAKIRRADGLAALQELRKLGEYEGPQ